MKVRQLGYWEIEPFVQSVVEGQEGKLAQVNVPFLCESWRSMVDRNIAVAFAIDKEELPGGFLLALYTPDMITGDLFAIQYLWMADPKAKLGRHAFKLLDAFEEEAKVRNCKKILGGLNEVHRPGPMAGMFMKRGYGPFSMAFSKEVK